MDFCTKTLWFNMKHEQDLTLPAFIPAKSRPARAVLLQQRNFLGRSLALLGQSQRGIEIAGGPHADRLKYDASASMTATHNETDMHAITRRPD